MSSFKEINYRLRLAKSTERKMMCDAFSRLAVFHPLLDYLYVGMGSTSFNDFSLFHRQLGIKELVSMEKEARCQSRFQFNRPFDCITVLFGDSSDVLTELAINRKCIVWLDYDGRLSKNVINDLEYVLSSVKPGSMIVVSVNVHPLITKEPVVDIHKKRLEELVTNVGKSRVPIEIDGKELSGWGTAKVCYRIVREVFDTVILERSTLRSLEFIQVFHFWYEDGSKMLTIGGLLAGPEEKEKLALASFDRLPFYKNGPDPFKITIPSLTFREMRFLDQFLPDGLDHLRDDKNHDVIPESDVRAYQAIYRYCPLFAETDL